MKKFIVVVVAVATIACSCDIAVIGGSGESRFDKSEFNVTSPWLDLGLPSGTQWFCMNVGAKTISDVGNFYAWGEPEPKTDYSWNTYFDWDGTKSKIDGCYIYNCSKYNQSYGYLHELADEDDICTQKYGVKAHTPNITEWQELFDNTTESFEVVNGVQCVVYTSKINGVPVYFPMGGIKTGTNHWPGTINLEQSKPIAWLWTANLIPEDGFYCSTMGGTAVYVSFDSSVFYVNGVPYSTNDSLASTQDRCRGLNVRAVKSIK